MKSNSSIKAITISLLSILLISCAGSNSASKTQSPDWASDDSAEAQKLQALSKKLEEKTQRSNQVKAATDENSSRNTIKKGNITLQEAAQAIVFYHPRVTQAKGDERTEEELITIAESKYYPQISGGIGMRRDSNRSDRYDREFLQDINLNIEQVLYDFGKRSSEVKSAEYSYLTAKAYTSMTNEELAHMAALAVVSTDRYKQLTELAKGQVARVSALGKLVEERYEKGASNLSDVYQAKSRLDDVLSEELDTVTQHQSILRTLGIIIGQPQITSATVGKLPTTLAAACAVDPEWSAIPAYQVAELEAERALAELERARADELPTISIRGNASRALNATPRYGSRIDSTVSLNVSMPVYQGGGLSASKRAAASRARTADAKKAEVRLDVSQKMDDTRIHLENLHKRKNLLSQRVENLRNTKELYKKQYLELGTRTLVDLLNSEREYHQAQVEVVNNQFDIIQAQLDCAFYQGKLKEVLKIETY